MTVSFRFILLQSRLKRALESLRWAILPLTLTGSVVAFTLGHGIASYKHPYPNCSRFDDMGVIIGPCLKVQALPTWETWALPIGIGLLLLALGLLAVTHFSLATSFLDTRIGMLLWRYSSKRGRLANLHRYGSHFEAIAWRVGWYLVTAALIAVVPVACKEVFATLSGTLKTFIWWP